ncbi:MAG TPA: alpha-galactosidase, partial [Acidimicrobiales bacterium]
PALRVTHAGGSTITRLAFDGHHAEPTDQGEAHTVTLRDPLEGLTVRLRFATHVATGVIEQWVEVANDEPGPIVVHELAAAAPAMLGTDPWLTHHGGGWSAEWTTTTERLTPGTKVLDSKGGIRPHLYRNPFFLLAPAGPATEDEGLVVAGALAWGGNIRLAFERAPHDQLRVLCGHNPLGTDLRLEPGETFRTPTMTWAWSAAGVGPLSRRLHRYVREEVVRDGARPRAIVANNWEATYFDFDEARLVGLVDGAADLGAELFLLDDGWFGPDQPRDDDTTSLGDWEPDPRKLPRGLAPVIRAALDRRIRFGLWVEPEMVNARSTLYEQHPDWVVHAPGRERREERQQLVLDLTRPEVAEWAGAVVDRLLAENPGTSYLKWDANRDVTEPASPTLGADRQGRYWVDLARATGELMARVAARHPDVELMLCASGGGRVDLASLRSFHEVWTSDNTDPVDRVRMQWAASIYLPPLVLAAHVTRAGDRPIAFASAVAMSARFGFDVDLAALTDEERATAARAVAAYRRIRSLVQQGDLYRLVSPLETDRAALAYVEPGGSRAVVFAYQLADGTGASTTGGLAVSGLDPKRSYAVQAVDLSSDAVTPVVHHTGAELESGALRWPLGDAATAAIWELAAEDVGG